MNSLR